VDAGPPRCTPHAPYRTNAESQGLGRNRPAQNRCARESSSVRKLPCRRWRHCVRCTVTEQWYAIEVTRFIDRLEPDKSFFIDLKSTQTGAAFFLRTAARGEASNIVRHEIAVGIAAPPNNAREERIFRILDDGLRRHVPHPTFDRYPIAIGSNIVVGQVAVRDITTDHAGRGVNVPEPLSDGGGDIRRDLPNISDRSGEQLDDKKGGFHFFKLAGVSSPLQLTWPRAGEIKFNCA
jgi:hypothetical protein